MVTVKVTISTQLNRFIQENNTIPGIQVTSIEQCIMYKDNGVSA